HCTGGVHAVRDGHDLIAGHGHKVDDRACRCGRARCRQHQGNEPRDDTRQRRQKSADSMHEYLTVLRVWNPTNEPNGASPSPQWVVCTRGAGPTVGPRRWVTCTVMETLIVERAGGIVTVTLNRPERKNAMNMAMWNEMRDTFREVAARADDRVMVITGAGDG